MMDLSADAIAVSIAALVSAVLGGCQYITSREIDRVRAETEATKARVAVLERRLARVDESPKIRPQPRQEVRT